LDFKISHYLLEGMLDHGLPFVGSYLEKKIGRPVIITDANGRICYPDRWDSVQNADDLFINININFDRHSRPPPKKAIYNGVMIKEPPNHFFLYHIHKAWHSSSL
jgi:hypothetical protein